MKPQIIAIVGNLICTTMGKKSIFTAARDGDIQKIQQFLNEGVDVNIKDKKRGRRPLHYAIVNGRTEVVKFLLTQPNIAINAPEKTGGTALHFASYMGNEKIVKLLLADSRIKINIKDEAGRTPLYGAVGSSRRSEIKKLFMEALKLFLSLFVFNAKNTDKIGSAPVSTDIGNIKSIKLLMNEVDIDVNATDRDGASPLHIASYKGRVDVVKILLADSKIKVNGLWDGKGPLMLATSHGREEVVKLLLEHPTIDINAIDKKGVTALFCAIGFNRISIMKLLLADPNIELNSLSCCDRTPLMYAIERSLTAVKHLLSHPKTDINATNSDGWTALMYASKWSHEEIIKLLLDHPNINIHKKNLANDTTLGLAKKRRVQKLLNNTLL